MKRRKRQSKSSNRAASDVRDKSDTEDSTGSPDTTKPPGGSESDDDDMRPTDAAKAPAAALPPPAAAGLSMARVLSVVMLIAATLVVGFFFLRLMAGFFVPLFLAALLTVIFRPLHHYLLSVTRFRRSLAAGLTTAAIALIVLLPIIGVISMATTQLTSLVGRLDFDDIQSRFDEVRGQLGLNLTEPQKFRRLDVLTDRLDRLDPTDVEEFDERRLEADIGETRELVVYLDRELRGDADPPVTDPGEETRDLIAALDDFSDSVARHRTIGGDEGVLQRIDYEEEVHRRSIRAAAATRAWIRSSLGGTLRSQAKMLANPGAEDFRGALTQARDVLQPRFFTLTSRTGSYIAQWLVGLVVLLIAVYFFLLDGNRMTRTMMRLSPLDDEYEAELIDKFDRTSRAVVVASLASAVVQGVLATIGFWVAGVDGLFILFIATTVLALVPFLGAAAVWLPTAIYLAAAEQRFVAAIILAIYGAGVVSSVDNVIKVYVLQGRSAIHPLLALLSVLGGLAVFGPVGILVGPMVVVFLQTLLELLHKELTEGERSRRRTSSQTPPQS